MTADNNSSSRRDFFYLAGALAVGAASGQNRAEAVAPISPQIGILLATTFTTGTLEERLDAAKANGLACVQMSMAAAGLPEMPDQIPAELPDGMRRESSARGHRDSQHDRHLQHDSPGRGTSPDGTAATARSSRGMPADRHILHSYMHWHA